MSRHESTFLFHAQKQNHKRNKGRRGKARAGIKSLSLWTFLAFREIFFLNGYEDKNF